MHDSRDDIPDPIQRNRRERRLGWVMFALLVALGWAAASLAASPPGEAGAVPGHEAAEAP